MDYYVATKLEIYRKCLVIGKYTDQKKKGCYIHIQYHIKYSKCRERKLTDFPKHPKYTYNTQRISI